MSGRLDKVSLVAGLTVAAMGALLWLDQEGTIDLTLGLFGALASAVIGFILVVSGTAQEERRDAGD